MIHISGQTKKQLSKAQTNKQISSGIITSLLKTFNYHVHCLTVLTLSHKSKSSRFVCLDSHALESNPPLFIFDLIGKVFSVIFNISQLK